jgi:hypothetical protein
MSIGLIWARAAGECWSEVNNQKPEAVAASGFLYREWQMPGRGSSYKTQIFFRCVFQVSIFAAQVFRQQL